MRLTRGNSTAAGVGVKDWDRDLRRCRKDYSSTVLVNTYLKQGRGKKGEKKTSVGFAKKNPFLYVTALRSGKRNPIPTFVGRRVLVAKVQKKVKEAAQTGRGGCRGLYLRKTFGEMGGEMHAPPRDRVE